MIGAMVFGAATALLAHHVIAMWLAARDRRRTDSIIDRLNWRQNRR